MLRKLRRLSELSAGELLVFLQLCLFALAVRFFLKFISLPRLVSVLSASADSRFLKQVPLLHFSQHSSRLLVLADWSARAIRPEGPCLLRSLLLFWLLKARGESVELAIGVRKEGNFLNSHAWIESNGKVLGETENGPLRFATLLRFEAGN